MPDERMKTDIKRRILGDVGYIVVIGSELTEKDTEHLIETLESYGTIHWVMEAGFARAFVEALELQVDVLERELLVAKHHG